MGKVLVKVQVYFLQILELDLQVLVSHVGTFKGGVKLDVDFFQLTQGQLQEKYIQLVQVGIL